MAMREQTILVVSDDVAWCAEARRELEATAERRRVSSVHTVDAARKILEVTPVAAILLEEKVLGAETNPPLGRKPRLESVVSTLAGYAPVVVMGAAEHQAEVAALVAAGVVDYVAHGCSCRPTALELVEKRLRQAYSAVAHTIHEVKHGNGDASGEFGEVLRHELNNPLTGILGNAELLLAEVRRKSDGRIPHGAQQRLETIAALAVRMRETVRRLSQELEAR
jgi:signal transduction histidine kinase